MWCQVWDLACGVKFGTLLVVEGSPIDSKLSYEPVESKLTRRVRVWCRPGWLKNS